MLGGGPERYTKVIGDIAKRTPICARRSPFAKRPKGVWQRTYIRLQRIVFESVTEAADVLMDRAIEMGSDPKSAPWLEDFTAEVLAFPGRHDDQVDALTQGLAWGRSMWSHRARFGRVVC